MCEIPSNVVLASELAERFGGFSIGSNYLTQLTLGVDRDSARLAELFDEDNPGVKRLVTDVVAAAHRAKRKVCGEAPSNRPRFAQFLGEAGIDSISVSPHSFFAVTQHVALAEKGLSRPKTPAAGLDQLRIKDLGVPFRWVTVILADLRLDERGPFPWRRLDASSGLEPGLHRKRMLRRFARSRFISRSHDHLSSVGARLPSKIGGI